jgi:excisionase family DNA binding protein
MTKLLTVMEAAIELDVDTSRVQKLCRQKRLGYTHPKHGRAWVITQDEIDAYRAKGPKKPPGRPPRLIRIADDGTRVYES